MPAAGPAAARSVGEPRRPPRSLFGLRLWIRLVSLTPALSPQVETTRSPVLQQPALKHCFLSGWFCFFVWRSRLIGDICRAGRCVRCLFPPGQFHRQPTADSEMTAVAAVATAAPPPYPRPEHLPIPPPPARLAFIFQIGIGKRSGKSSPGVRWDRCESGGGLWRVSLSLPASSTAGHSVSFTSMSGGTLTLSRCLSLAATPSFHTHHPSVPSR